LLFDEYALRMKYLITELPVDCILGTPFLSAVEPHGSYKSSTGEPRYFITLPSIKGYPPKRVELPFISESHAQIAYCTKGMVIINAWDDSRNGPATHYLDDNTPWEIYTENWIPNWQLRSSEGIEFGLPGFSRNTNIHVIPPQQDRYRYYYCMIKFSVPFITFPEPDWLADWWQKFGLHPRGIHPDVTETAWMFLFPNMSLQTINDLYSEEEYKMLFIRERHPWIIRTRYVLQQDEDSDEDP
jgi:hypothetical protein